MTEETQKPATEQTEAAPVETPPAEAPAVFHDVMPVLPLKGTVVLPSMVVPLGVGRPKSLAALEAALTGDRVLLLVAQ